MHETKTITFNAIESNYIDWPECGSQILVNGKDYIVFAQMIVDRNRNAYHGKLDVGFSYQLIETYSRDLIEKFFNI